MDLQVTNPSLSERYTLFESRYKHIICYVYALLSAVFMATQNFLVKTLSHLSSSEILFYRSVQLFGLTMLMMETNKMQYHFKDIKINRLLIIRGLVGLISMSCNFYGVRILPLSESSVISQTSPVFVGILATVFLKEKYERSQFFVALFCFTGVLLVAQPEFLFHVDEDKREEISRRTLGVIALLIGTISVAATQVLVKTIGSKTNEGVVTFYFAAIAAMFSPLLMLFQGCHTLTVNDLLPIILIGILSFLVQIFRNKAFILGPPGKVSMISYFGILYSMFLDVFIMKADLDTFSVLGAICIFSSVFIFLYLMLKKEAQKK